MTHDKNSIELRIAEGLRLRAEFAWCADRYGHCITLIQRDDEQTLLQSLEGEPDEPWPPSPALQQLSVQGDGDQQVALLVGMAGKSHWSMSVEASVARRGIVFDVACRLSRAAEFVGSSYLARGHSLSNARCLILPASEFELSVALDPMPQDQQSLTCSVDQFSIRCLVPPTTTAQTVRWKYAVSLVELPVERV